MIARSLIPFVTALVFSPAAVAQSHTADAVPWTWTGLPPGHRADALVVAHGPAGERCTFTYTETTWSTRVECQMRGVAWHDDEGDAFIEAGALVIHGHTLYVLRYGAISSGATLSAYDLATGARRWRSPLRALGPIAHSEYLNASELRWHGADLVVYGWESGGRYIEVVDPATGATRSSRVLGR